MTRLAVGPVEQHASEEIAWGIDVAKWTASPASPAVTAVIDVATGKDVTATVMPAGSASVSGTTITLPVLKALTPGKQYNVFVKWSDGSQVKEMALFVDCPRRDSR